MSSSLRPRTPQDRLDTIFDAGKARGSFSDPEIEEISLLLAHCEPEATKSPRTYIVLRAIGRLDLLKHFLRAGFGDWWIPVKPRGLPELQNPKLSPQDRAAFLENQHLVYTKSIHLENGRHCHYAPEEQLPFDVLAEIGSGGYGTISKVQSKSSFKTYALKTVHRRIRFDNQALKHIEDFLREVNTIRRLKHNHVVQYIGSFTSGQHLGLLISPIADCDLAVYLEGASTETQHHPNIRKFFGCLATALEFLHKNNIKHRDIKPENILVHKVNVLLTDFGLARESLNTTKGATDKTLRYCAPEVAEQEERNWSADVWSLGCVYLEMMAALQGHNVKWLEAFYETHGEWSHFQKNPTATELLLSDWNIKLDGQPAKPLAWIEKMLVLDRQSRPSAVSIAAEITMSDHPTGFMYSCNRCNDNGQDSQSGMGPSEDTGLSTETNLRFDERSISTLLVATHNPAVSSQNIQTVGPGQAESIGSTASTVLPETDSIIWFDASTDFDAVTEILASETSALHEYRDVSGIPVPSNESSKRLTIDTKLEAEQHELTSESGSIAGVFGHTLDDAVQLAGQDISHLSLKLRGVKTHLVGKVPTIVARCVEKILQGDSNWIHAETRDTRLRQKPEFLGQLKQAFNAAPDYGLHLSWKNYRTLDAANVLFDYLDSLPEPLIPDLLRRQFPYSELEHQKAYAPSKLSMLELYSTVLVSLPTESYHLLLCMVAVLSSRAQSRQDIFSGLGWTNRAAQFCSHILCNEPAQRTAIFTLLIVNADYFLSVAKGKPKTAKQWQMIIAKGTESQQLENNFTAQMQKDIAKAKREADSTPRKEQTNAPAMESGGDSTAATVGSRSPKEDGEKGEPRQGSDKKANPNHKDTEGDIRRTGKDRSTDFNDETATKTLPSVAARQATSAKPKQDKTAKAQMERQDDSHQGDRKSKEGQSRTRKVNDVAAANEKEAQSTSSVDPGIESSRGVSLNRNDASPKMDPATKNTAPRKKKTRIDSSSHTTQDQDRDVTLQAVPKIVIDEGEIVAPKGKGKRPKLKEGITAQVLPEDGVEEQETVTAKDSVKIPKSKKTNRALKDATILEPRVKTHRVEAAPTDDHTKNKPASGGQDDARKYMKSGLRTDASPRVSDQEAKASRQASSKSRDDGRKKERDEERTTKQVRAGADKETTPNRIEQKAGHLTAEQAATSAETARRKRETGGTPAADRARIGVGAMAAYGTDRDRTGNASYLDVPRVRTRGEEARPSQVRRASSTADRNKAVREERRRSSDEDTQHYRRYSSAPEALQRTSSRRDSSTADQDIAVREERRRSSDETTQRYGRRADTPAPAETRRRTSGHSLLKWMVT